jgi:hypothetical protein
LVALLNNHFPKITAEFAKQSQASWIIFQHHSLRLLKTWDGRPISTVLQSSHPKHVNGRQQSPAHRRFSQKKCCALDEWQLRRAAPQHCLVSLNGSKGPFVSLDTKGGKHA